MNIVIFAGGSGSQNLQKGLFKVFGPDVNYSVITNLFDNGKSTGECRRLAHGLILGPSDLRKNQLLRHELLYGKTDFYNALEKRIEGSGQDIKDASIAVVKNYPEIIKAIEGFFLPEYLSRTFKDFCIANVVYAALFMRAGEEKTADIMAEILKIPRNSVIVASTEPYYLKAKTEHKVIIEDEGDIVAWNNPNDKIVRTFLTQEEQNDHYEVEGTLTKTARNAIADADIIIFSSGTLWSSLIPTYDLKGCISAIQSSSAKKYLILNCAVDGDIHGLTGKEVYALAHSHLPGIDTIDIVASNGEITVPPREICHEYIWKNFANSGVHDGEMVVKEIFKNFMDLDKTETFVFDYDDTLFGRDGGTYDISVKNCEMIDRLSGRIPIHICTGNSIDAIGYKFKNAYVFADRGLNQYFAHGKKYIHKSILDDSLLIDKKSIETISSALKEAGIADNKVIVRANGAVIAIKPVVKEYRQSVKELVERIITEILPKSNLVVQLTGRTTVEISNKNLNKSVFAEKILKDSNFYYIGDEIDGNDSEIMRHRNAYSINVTDVKDTNALLTTLCTIYL